MSRPPSIFKRITLCNVDVNKRDGAYATVPSRGYSPDYNNIENDRESGRWVVVDEREKAKKKKKKAGVFI